MRSRLFVCVVAAAAHSTECPSRIVFVHARKSGGTSFTEWLAAQWCAGFTENALPSPRDARRSSFRIDHNEGVVLNLTWIHAPGVRLVTILRDPIARAISGFTYEGNRATTFGEYFDRLVQGSFEPEFMKGRPPPGMQTRLWFEASNYYVQLYSGKLRTPHGPSWSELVASNTTLWSNNAWQSAYNLADASLDAFAAVLILELFDDVRQCLWVANKLGLVFGGIDTVCADGSKHALNVRKDPPEKGRDIYKPNRVAYAADLPAEERACLHRLNLWDIKLYAGWRRRTEAAIGAEMAPPIYAGCAQDARSDWGSSRFHDRIAEEAASLCNERRAP